MRISTTAILLLAGCNIELPEPRNCEVRTAYYPDEDGDGVGEPTEVYLGCEPPEGWVDNVDTADPYAGARRRARTSGFRRPPAEPTR